MVKFGSVRWNNKTSDVGVDMASLGYPDVKVTVTLEYIHYMEKVMKDFVILDQDMSGNFKVKDRGSNSTKFINAYTLMRKYLVGYRQYEDLDILRFCTRNGIPEDVFFVIGGVAKKNHDGTIDFTVQDHITHFMMHCDWGLPGYSLLKGMYVKRGISCIYQGDHISPNESNSTLIIGTISEDFLDHIEFLR